MMLVQAAANQYLSVNHHGFRIAGKFERGGHRGGGEMINSLERDRMRALQLLVQAMPLAQAETMQWLTPRAPNRIEI